MYIFTFWSISKIRLIFTLEKHDKSDETEHTEVMSQYFPNFVDFKTFTNHSLQTQFHTCTGEMLSSQCFTGNFPPWANNNDYCTVYLHARHTLLLTGILTIFGLHESCVNSTLWLSHSKFVRFLKIRIYPLAYACMNQNTGSCKHQKSVWINQYSCFIDDAGRCR